MTRPPPASAYWKSSAPTTAFVGATVVLIAFLALVLLIGPLREFPVEDDWDYSKTTLNLLQTGSFHRLEVTQATVFFPAVWGALFSKLFGYSFATLRLSTLVLAAGALLLFYALLGELEFDVPRRVLATLALMVAPLFVYLAFSFMTDVPFFFGLVGALYGYVRALRQHTLHWALVGSAFAALAFLARQVGALIPLSFGLFVGVTYVRRTHTHSLSETVRWIVAGTLVPLAAVGTYFVWTQFLGGANWADRTRTFGGTLGFWFQPDIVGVLRRRSVIGAATIGIYLLPLWLGASAALMRVPHAWRASARWQKALMLLLALGFGVTLVQLALHDEWFPYLTDILTRRGLRPYLAYFAYNMEAHRPFVFALPASALLTIIAGTLGLLLTWLMVARLSRPISPTLAFVYLMGLVLAVFSLSFFTYFERYLLPLMPAAIILLLDMTRRSRLSLLMGGIGFVIVAASSVALMRDYFAWNEVKWNAGRALLASGVPVEQIDGGYEWDGWYLYDASMAYIRAHNAPITIDPWQYVLDPEFIFAFQPPPGYRIVQTLPFESPLRAGGSDQLYLLQRAP